MQLYKKLVLLVMLVSSGLYASQPDKNTSINVEKNREGQQEVSLRRKTMDMFVAAFLAIKWSGDIDTAMIRRYEEEK